MKALKHVPLLAVAWVLYNLLVLSGSGVLEKELFPGVLSRAASGCSRRET